MKAYQIVFEAFDHSYYETWISREAAQIKLPLDEKFREVSPTILKALFSYYQVVVTKVNPRYVSILS